MRNRRAIRSEYSMGSVEPDEYINFRNYQNLYNQLHIQLHIHVGKPLCYFIASFRLHFQKAAKRDGVSRHLASLATP